MEHVTHFFLSLVDSAGYFGLFVVMVLGNVGVPIGTELVLPAAGALVAKGHLSNLWVASAVATFGEVVGGTILYVIGYVGGRAFVARWGKYFKLDEHKLDTFHSFYERYGNAIVFVCRFVPVVRGISGLPAGVSRMPKRYFWVYTAIGSAFYCVGLILLGNAFDRHLNEILPLIRRFSIAFVVLLALAVVLFFVVRRRANRGSEPA
ncbi:MAG: DedA family protein [Vulcanimicrobiaceae bacterium]